MKLIIAILLAVSLVLEANAYDGNVTSAGSSGQYYPYGSQPQPESSYPYGPAVPNERGYSAPYSLWIVGAEQMTQYLQCPTFTQLRLVAYSPGGPATMSEIYPDGHQTSNSYQFEPGNTEITFMADVPGRHTLGYEIYGQMSNVVIIDVGQTGGISGPSYPGGSNHPPEVHSLKAPPTEGYPGASITFTADAYDQDGDQILYKFWIAPGYCDLDKVDFNDYQPVTDWTTTNSWTWYPQESDFGIHTIMVDVRDGSHQPPESWDDFAETTSSICHHDPRLGTSLNNCPMCPYAASLNKANRKTLRPKVNIHKKASK
jgi:hypothetical protein